MLIPIALEIFWSFRLLPPIWEIPPDLSDREDQNWVGQGGWAFAINSFSLLLIAYLLKRLIVTFCKTRGMAVYWFSLVVGLSLPYVWFLCEPDWFNSQVYREACWIGAPIAVWFIPTLSFLVDLYFMGTKPPLETYLVRSTIEIAMIFPIWILFWVHFNIFVLGWVWI
jgi:hypothetical protein